MHIFLPPFTLDLASAHEQDRRFESRRSVQKTIVASGVGTGAPVRPVRDTFGWPGHLAGPGTHATFRGRRPPHHRLSRRRPLFRSHRDSNSIQREATLSVPARVQSPGSAPLLRCSRAAPSRPPAPWPRPRPPQPRCCRGPLPARRAPAPRRRPQPRLAGGASSRSGTRARTPHPRLASLATGAGGRPPGVRPVACAMPPCERIAVPPFAQLGVIGSRILTNLCLLVD